MSSGVKTYKILDKGNLLVKKSFTTGSVSRQLATFSFPILLANLLQASMQVINSLWVGNLLGSGAFAVVTIGATVMTVVLAFVLGINNATLTIFGQLRGAKDPQKTTDYLSAFIIILTVLSVAISVVGFFFVEWLLGLMNTPLSIVDETKVYLRINFVGTIFLVGYNFIGTTLRAFGDSKTPLYFVLLATVLAAILDPLFIAGFGLGVAGAAYATVLAQSLAFVYGIVYLSRRFKNHSFRLQPLKWRESKTILELGIPSGIQMVVIYAGLTVILSLVNSLGEAAVAGFGAAQRLDSIILLPALSLGTAVNTMAAQNIGAQQWDRVGQISKIGVIYNLVVMISIAVILFVWAEPLVKLFVREQASVSFGITYLKTIACFYPFIGLNFILNAVVRGAGAMFQVLVLNIISLWLLRIPLAYWATSLYGDSGVALGIGISFFISSLFSIAYYRYGGWRNKELFA